MIWHLILHLSHLHICRIDIFLHVGFLSTGGVLKVILFWDTVLVDGRRVQLDHDAVLVLADNLQHSRFLGSEIRNGVAQVSCSRELKCTSYSQFTSILHHYCMHKYIDITSQAKPINPN